jgi:hypothetical protein
MKEGLLAEFELIRSRTVNLLEGVSEEMADVIPEGFRNNLRWHFGHIYTVHEQLLMRNLKQPFQLPETFPKWFGNGTSPAEWVTAPPTLAELKNCLQEQANRTKQIFSSMELSEEFPEPIALGKSLLFTRVSDLFSFMFYHEGSHSGFLKALINCSKKQ